MYICKDTRGVYGSMIEEIHVTEEEYSDWNNDYVWKIKGIALGRKEKIIVQKINEIIQALNTGDLQL